MPFGIYSATHQYSALDYLFTFFGFIGMATPGFLLALILAWLLFSKFGFSALGLHSKEFLDAALELGQVCRSAQAPVDAVAPGGHGQHRRRRSAWCATTCSTSCISSM